MLGRISVAMGATSRIVPAPEGADSVPDPAEVKDVPSAESDPTRSSQSQPSVISSVPLSRADRDVMTAEDSSPAALEQVCGSVYKGAQRLFPSLKEAL